MTTQLEMANKPDSIHEANSIVQKKIQTGAIPSLSRHSNVPIGVYSYAGI